MSNERNTPNSQDDMGVDDLDRETHDILGLLGWRLPKSADEVQAAEEWLRSHQATLPERLLGKTGERLRSETPEPRQDRVTMEHDAREDDMRRRKQRELDDDIEHGLEL